MTVVLCAPAATTSTRILRCVTCKRRRRCRVDWYEWYGPTVTCGACGEQWSDGEILPRPFAPGWRRKNVTYARAAFRAARQPVDPHVTASGGSAATPEDRPPQPPAQQPESRLPPDDSA